jgi:hypothetical protein
MPYNFSAIAVQKTPKLGVVYDGNTFTGAPTVLTSGSKATLTLSGSTVTLTGGAGFTSGMGGDKIYISGAATSANNGWFTLTYISATSVSWTNSSGATDANNGAISFQVAAVGASTLSNAPSTRTVFTGAPVRSGTGAWSITTLDSVVETLDFHVESILPSGEYIATQLVTDVVVPTTGQRTYKWVFNVGGTPTDLPYPGQFRVYLAYSEMKDGV